ncbi:MAG TPA: DUF1573 domain-containing protein [Candidatus Kaiserbacteria bacterium]|nr:DUF1573 domain-containing protein [Candidatus Kaiserbacteria bacterium]
MNKYVIWALILAGTLIIASYGISNNKTKISKVSSLISVSEPTYNFGDIDIFSGKVNTTYTLKNEGNEDVSIVSAVTSCVCTEGKIDDLEFGMHKSTGKVVVIPAGGEKVLTATYDPLAHGPNGVGKVKRELYLKTNSTVTPEIKVAFFANVTKNNVPDANYKNISSQELSDMLNKEKDFTLINVHTPYIGEIANTDELIAFNDIQNNLDKLPTDKDAKIVVYCQSGGMSESAAQILIGLGYTDVDNLSGGMINWKKNGYEIIINNRDI